MADLQGRPPGWPQKIYIGGQIWDVDEAIAAGMLALPEGESKGTGVGLLEQGGQSQQPLVEATTLARTPEAQRILDLLVPQDPEGTERGGMLPFRTRPEGPQMDLWSQAMRQANPFTAALPPHLEWALPEFARDTIRGIVDTGDQLGMAARRTAGFPTPEGPIGLPLNFPLAMMDLMGGGPSRGADNALGVFIGGRANLAREERRDLARSMTASSRGRPREETYDSLGWFTGPDALWRKEQSDALAQLKSDALNMGDTVSLAREGATLGDILDHPALYNYYPELANVPVYTMPPSEWGAAVHYSASRAYPLGRIGIKPMKRQEFLESLLHEIQHDIQDREGFARGSSPETWADNVGWVPEQDKEIDDAIASASQVITQGPWRPPGGYEMSIFDYLKEMTRSGRDESGRLRSLNDFKSAIEYEYGRAALELGDNYDPSTPQSQEIFGYLKALNDLNVAGERAAQQEIAKDAAEEMYMRSYGEAEARNVERRHPLSGVHYNASGFRTTPDRADAVQHASARYPWESMDRAQTDLHAHGPQGAALAGEVARQTQTPEFRNWFGDSKIVDESGEPLVVYHGTGGDIEGGVFQKPDSVFGGFYFTKNPEYAESYSRRPSSGEAPAMFPVYLSLKNPLVIDRQVSPMRALTRVLDEAADSVRTREQRRAADNRRWEEDFRDRRRDEYRRSMALRPEEIQALKDQGYDGIVNNVWDEIVVFEPEQIKSAIGNSGAFDPSNPNILAANAGTRAPVAAHAGDIPEWFTNWSELPDDVAWAFNRLGEAQRGLPERAMLDVQDKIGGGVLNPVVEHVGDLTHRMSHHVGYNATYPETIRNKTKQALYYLEHPYGFEREMQENLAVNLRSSGRNIPPEEFQREIDASLARYAEEHEKLPVYNRPQWLARESAVAVGRQDWDRARQLLHELDDLAKQDNWEELALSYKTDRQGKLEEYSE